MTEKKKRLKELPDYGQANARRPVRMVKMLRPRCYSIDPDGKQSPLCEAKGYGWWNDCPHDPYHDDITEKVSEPILKQQGDELLIEGYKEKFVMRKAPCIVQIPVHARIGSGLEGEKALSLGHKFPEDVQPPDKDEEGNFRYDAYAPMCEFRDCFKPNPKIRMRHASLDQQDVRARVPDRWRLGYYCSERHAKEIQFKESGVPREVFNNEARQAQYDRISIPVA